MIFFGIDPGGSGGIAVIDHASRVLLARQMPSTDREIYEAFVSTMQSLQGQAVDARAMLERVSASPGMGVSSSFVFGSNYGKLSMALCAAGIPYDTVHPSTWLKAMGLGAARGESSGKFGQPDRRRRDKNISKARAEQLFPNVTITHATAEALLLAEYALRVYRGQLSAPPPPKAARSSRASKTSLF